MMHFPASSSVSFYATGAGSASQLSRRVRAEEYSIRNRLKSIEDDRRFVEGVCESYKRMPVFANLRCGVWYLSSAVSSRAAEPCYFKSTDGHCGHWKFSDTRLNAHLLRAITADGVPGGIIVDSTRKGKRFPDSFSRTIPIWCAVWNRAIQQVRQQTNTETDEQKLAWDTELHMPTWVSAMESHQIESRLPTFVATLLGSGVDLESIARDLRKPLRCLWMDRTSRGWENGDEEFHLLPFTPLLLVQCSRVESETRGVGQRQGWSYIQGAGDDEENWTTVGDIRGFTHAHLSAHSKEISQLDYEEDVIERIQEIIREEQAERRKETTTQVNLHHVDDLDAFVSVRNSVPSRSSVESALASSSAADSASSTSSPPLALLYLYFDNTLSVKQHRKQKLAADQERKVQRALSNDDDESDPEEARQEDDHLADGGEEQVDVDLAPPKVDLLDWHADHSASIAISSQAKSRRALLDILSPALEFLTHHRQQGRTPLIVCEDVSFLSCLCTAAVLRIVNSGIKVDKSSIRSMLASVQSSLPPNFPSRLLLKQLNLFFMQHG